MAVPGKISMFVALCAAFEEAGWLVVLTRITSKSASPYPEAPTAWFGVKPCCVTLVSYAERQKKVVPDQWLA